jgi:cardiolipin synthase
MTDLSTNVWALIDLAVLVYWVGVSILVISQDREPTATLAWLLVLFAIPFLGLLVYFFFGRDWPSNVQRAPATRRLKEILGRFMPAVYSPYVERSSDFVAGLPVEQARIALVAERKLGVPVLPVRTCEIYGSGQEYFDLLVADLAAARRFIHMNYFIWGKDELTARITRVLHERLAAGVEVRILNDLVGCITYSKSELDGLRKAGAKVGSDLAQLARVNYRNHRKITVIDAEVGHSGGFNVGQEYIDGGKRFPAWRDTGIRMTGPGVADLEKLFDMRWYEVFGEDLFQPGYYPDASLPAGDIMVQTVHQGFDDPWNAATRAHQLAISGARKRVLLQSPYLVPDQTTLDVLINAASGGVEVDFMTTGTPDKNVPWWAAESYFERLLRGGVRIWLWEKGFFHAKTLTVDGEVCSIGTLNLDVRSLRINKELMIWVYDGNVARESERLFREDLRDCRQVTLDEVRAWSRARRFRNSTARLLSNLL